MKNRIGKYRWGVLLLLSLVGVAHSYAVDSFSRKLYSPSKEILLSIGSVNGKMEYEVSYKNTPILLSSQFVWKVDGRELGYRLSAVNMKKGKTEKTSFSVMGNHAVAQSKYKPYTLEISDTSGDTYQMEFRLYDDGVAFRYVIENGTTVAVDDQTTFKFPQGNTCWLQPNARFYEDNYSAYDTGQLPKDIIAGPPVTVKYSNGIYASITEGGLANFGGMGLKVIAPDCFQSSLEGETRLSGKIATPWRVVMIGDLNSLVNNDIVFDVSEPLSPVFGGNTEWIKPGNCVWSWLAGYGVSLDNMKRFSDWAAELGIHYNLVDEGWSHWEDKEKGLDAWQMVKELVEYSRKNGVKIWLWKAYPDRKGIEGIQTSERRRRFFKKCQELGIAGLKIDFFDTESQTITRYYEETLKDAAEFGLMINFHGSNKPTGLNRTYPNEVSREAIKGLEYGSTDVRQNVVTPFTRFLVGHADYTPLAFEKGRMGNSTEAHQIAMTTIFLSPLCCYGGRPQDYMTHPARELFLSMPTVWDETIVLPPSEIGKCVVMAKRKGNDWYVAAMTDEAKNISLPLSFLSKGEYKTDLVFDSVDGDKKSSISHAVYTRGNTLKIKMETGGGFLARLSLIK